MPSAMVYPSHYANGVFGLKVPDAILTKRYRPPCRGLAEELQGDSGSGTGRGKTLAAGHLRPPVPGHISYNGTQIREQIQAVYDAGYEEWILWNATNRYSPDGLLAAGEEKQ